MNKLKHKGYIGSVECDEKNDVLYGRLLYIKDSVTYEGNTFSELKQAFVDAVEDYLEFCNEEGKQPEKPFSGTFNVRVSSDIHRQAYELSNKLDLKLNEFVKKAVIHEIERLSE